MSSKSIFFSLGTEKQCALSSFSLTLHFPPVACFIAQLLHNVGCLHPTALPSQIQKAKREEEAKEAKKRFIERKDGERDIMDCSQKN